MSSDAFLIEVENYEDNETNKHLLSAIYKYMWSYIYIYDLLVHIFLLQSLKIQRMNSNYTLHPSTMSHNCFKTLSIYPKKLRSDWKKKESFT